MFAFRQRALAVSLLCGLALAYAPTSSGTPLQLSLLMNVVQLGPTRNRLMQVVSHLPGKPNNPNDELDKLSEALAADERAWNWSKSAELAEKFLTLARTYKLGSNQSFRQAMWDLFIYSPIIKRDKVHFRDEYLRIFDADGVADNFIGSLCVDVANDIFSGLMASPYPTNLDEADNSYPICKNKMKEALRQRSEAADRHAEGIEENPKLDPVQQEALDRANEAMERRRPVIEALTKMRDGNFCSIAHLHSTMDSQSSESESTTNRARFSVTALLFMLCGDAVAARKFIFMIPKENDTEAPTETSVMPGFQDLVGPTSEEAPTAMAISVATTYHLKMAPQDDEVARNAFAVILREKGVELDEARKRFRFLKSLHTQGATNISDRLMHEYESASILWADQAMSGGNVANRDFKAVAAKIHGLEVEIDRVRPANTMVDGAGSRG